MRGPKYFIHRLSVRIMAAGCAWALAGCGNIQGGTPYFNDAPPNGTVIGNGTVTSVNGAAISGSVELYSVSGSGNVAIRLANYSAVAGSRYFIALQTGGTDSYVVQTKGDSGNQTYLTTVPVGATWSAVMFRTVSSGTAGPAYDRGRASITMVP